MKFEKISDKQLRCTLTKADFTEMNIQLGELAYGNEKARAFFHAMMVEAKKECGFDAGNCPIMIEAIPLSSGALTLVITRVDDPEELDTRFSKFTPVDTEEKEYDEPLLSGADEILRLYEEAKNLQKKLNEEANETQDPPKAKEKKDLAFLFTFSDLDTVISAAGALGGSYNGVNALYKNEKTGKYLLTLHKSSHSLTHFNKVCNTLSEYGDVSECTPVMEAHLNEHAQAIIKKRALQKLMTLN